MSAWIISGLIVLVFAAIFVSLGIFISRRAAKVMCDHDYIDRGYDSMCYKCGKVHQ